jgi:hypothetical protein
MRFAPFRLRMRVVACPGYAGYVMIAQFQFFGAAITVAKELQKCLMDMHDVVYRGSREVVWNHRIWKA